MTQKLSFSVEDAKLIKENPESNFAVLSLDFFASGENLNNMYVSEETLMRTADTIKNCPIVWKYDKNLDDVYTHDPDEVPCGFVPETSQIKSRKMGDGRTMLSVMAYVWKRYTGELLNIFKRDGGTKPVSVEMSVFDLKDEPGKKTEISDFKYEGITILGSFVTPAIRSAKATVLSFEALKDDYNRDYEKEFASLKSDMVIPKEVKENAEKGLELRKEHGSGATATAIASAHYLLNNETITAEKVKQFAKYLSRHKGDSLLNSERPTDSQITWLLMGGTEGWKWAESIVERLEKREEEQLAYANSDNILSFPYTSREGMNPALKGINPPITVAQGNEIAKQADAIGADKGGWGIAIKHFKDSHKVVDGKWVKKENMAKEVNVNASTEAEQKGETEKASEVSDCIDINSIGDKNNDKQDTYLSTEISRKEEEDMGDVIKQEEAVAASEDKQEEKMEEKVVENGEVMAEDKSEEMAEEEAPAEDKEEKKEEEMSEEPGVSEEVRAAMSVDTILEFMEAEAPLYREMKDKYGDKIIEIFKAFALEVAKGKQAVAKTLTSLLISYMAEASSKISEMKLELSNVTTERDSLKEYKKQAEAERYAFEVDSVLAEAFEAGMPKESIDALREDAKNFSLTSIDVYKNMVKAKAFVFVNNSKQSGQEEEIIKIGLPFGGEKPKSEEIWN